MISARRILHLRRVFPVNLLPFSVANWKLTSVCNQRIGDENVVRQWECGSVRYFGSYLKQWLRTTDEEELSESQIKMFKNFDRINQERATIGLMLNAIDCLASKYLLDKKSKVEKNLDVCMWDDQSSCRDYWLAVFEGSKTPLAIELEEKLKNKGISYKEFCHSMVTIYFTLKCQDNFILTIFKVEPEDVLNAMNRLQFNDTQRECLRILYSLHKMYYWKI